MTLGIWILILQLPSLAWAANCDPLRREREIALETLARQERPSPQSLAVLDGALAGVARGCSPGFGEMLRVHQQLARLPPHISGRYLKPRSFSQFIPVSLRLSSGNLSPERLWAWAWPEFRSTAATECIKASEPCAPLAFLDALSADAAPFPSSLPSAVRATLEEMGDLPQGLPAPRLGVGLLASSHSAWLAHLLETPFSADQIARWAPRAEFLIPLLPEESAYELSRCAVEREGWLSFFESQGPREISPRLLAFSSRRLSRWCERASFDGISDALSQLGSAVSSSRSRRRLTALAEEAESLADEDSQLQADLRLSLAPSLQHARNSREAWRRLRDELLGDTLRRADPAPWLWSDVQVEFLAEQRLAQRSLLKRVRHGIPGARLVSLAHLSVWGSVETAQTLINSIRERATSLAVRYPAARSLAVDVHNGLTPDLPLRLEALAAQPEAAAFVLDIRELKELIANVFVSRNSWQEHLQAVLMALPGKSAAPAKAAWSRFSRTRELSDACALGLALLRSADSRSLPEESYVRLLEVLLGLHGEIQRLAAQPGVKLPSARRATLVAYAFGLAGFDAPPSRESRPVALLGRKVQELFRERTERVNAFLSIQHLRSGISEEYRSSVEARAEALEGFSEGLVRAFGFHLLAPLLEDAVSLDTLRQRSMTEGEAVGNLVFVPKEKLGSHPYVATEILVTDGMPLNLGVTAGVITEVFQPFASHVDLRTRERGTPNAFVADARARWRHLLGQRVKLRVTETDVSIEGCDSVCSPTRRRHSKRLVPKIDADFSGLVDSDSAEASLSRVGAKAFGFAQLRKLFGGLSTPKAVGIPFREYGTALKMSGAETLVEALLRERATLGPGQLEERLERVRDALRGLASRAEFLESPFFVTLNRRLRQLAEETRGEKMAEGWDVAAGCFRFRSSTNAEDLLAFTGAGLYESGTGCVNPVGKRKGVAAALTKVWASLWTYRAFVEREQLGIDHSQVAMAVLVHRNWDDESVNGVLITASGKDGRQLISVQRGEDLVTNPEGKAVGEELVTSLDGASGKVRRLEVRRGQGESPILSDRELADLVGASERIRGHFASLYSEVRSQRSLRFDVEFKFVPSAGEGSRLVIKQARPFLGVLP